MPLSYRHNGKAQKKSSSRWSSCSASGVCSASMNHRPHLGIRIASTLSAIVLLTPSVMFVVMDDCMRQADQAAVDTFQISSLILLGSLLVHSLVVTWRHVFCNNLSSVTFLAVNIGFYLSVAAYFGFTAHFFKTLDPRFLIGVLLACVMWILLSTALLVEVHLVGCSDDSFHNVGGEGGAGKQTYKGPLSPQEKYKIALLVLDVIHWSTFFVTWFTSFWFIWGQLEALEQVDRGLCVP